MVPFIIKGTSDKRIPLHDKMTIVTYKQFKLSNDIEAFYEFNTSITGMDLLITSLIEIQIKTL